MSTYILLSSLTDEGIKTIKDRPSRVQEMNREIEAMGAKVVGQYAVLGIYDFINIVEAPDNETIAKVSVELASHGTVRIMSFPAIPIDHFVERVSVPIRPRRGRPPGRTSGKMASPRAGRAAGRVGRRQIGRITRRRRTVPRAGNPPSS